MKTYTIADFKPTPRDTTKPYRVFAACLDRTLGDFMARAYYLAALKLNRESKTDVTAYWVDDRPYKRPIMSLAPQIDRHIVANDGETLPLDSFYDTGDRRPLPRNLVSDEVTKSHARSDLILTPSMMQLRDLTQFAKFPTFQIPTDEAPKLMDRLRAEGLDFGRWHATIFYRLPNYKWRGPTPYRDVQDERAWAELSAYIIDGLGGQVVRIGHDGMGIFAEDGGGARFIDLSRDEDILLHAYAVAMARFCIVTPSGPALLPAAFNVPFAMANAVSALGCFRPDTIILPRPIYRADGAPLDIDRLKDSGLWTDAVVRDLTLNHGHYIRDNTAAELCGLADMLYERTKD